MAAGKGENFIFQFPSDIFQAGSSGGFFNNGEQSRADRLKYTLVFNVVLGGEYEFLVTKIKCSGFESLTLPPPTPTRKLTILAKFYRDIWHLKALSC